MNPESDIPAFNEIKLLNAFGIIRSFPMKMHSKWEILWTDSHAYYVVYPE